MSATQTSEQNKLTIRKLYEEILNTGRWELLNPIIADDFIGVQGQKGAAAFAETVRGLREGFPDIQWTVEDLIAEGDKVVVRWSWKATHSGNFRGFAPTHKALTDHAIAIYQFRNHQVVQAWLETDRLGFLQQIGLIPQDLAALRQPQK